MIQAIVWKEFREQGLIGLTLVVLGAAVLVTAAVLSDPPSAGVSAADPVRFLGAGRLATLLLVVTAGTVCGGALFAAEREAGTLGFLEALPASRWDLWVGKLAAGVTLVVCLVLPLLGLAALLGLVESGRVGLQLGLSALHAFVWGVYGSTLARTTLGSVGVAIPAAILAAFVYAIPIYLLFHHPYSGQVQPEGWLVHLALMFATPVAGSALVFTRPDRDRSADDRTAVRPRPVVVAGPARRAAPEAGPEAPPEPAAGRGPRLGLKALLWLAGRQLLLPGLVGSAFAVSFGMVLLLPTTQPVLAWPAFALAAGVLAGVTVFVDEQAHGSARFWGERRLPVGRAWAVKVGVHLAFAAWLLVLLGLPLLVQSQAAGDPVRPDTTLAAMFRSRLFESVGLGGEGWKYLLVPAAYGFASGHLCGLLFRKAVVATGVAGLVGGTAAAMWGPGLLAGGVHGWQLWLPVGLAVLTARLLMRPWAADRALTRGPLLTLAGGVAVVVLAIAAGVGYRAVEVPDDPAGEDDLPYVQALPGVEENKAGREYRRAADQLGRITYPEPNTARPAAAGPPVSPAEARLEQVPVVGVGGDDGVVDWLRKVYAPRPAGEEAWHRVAAAAADLPAGLFESPLLSSETTGVATLEFGRRMGLALVAHGLWRQQQGDPGAFPADLRTAFALARNFRNGSGVPAFRNGASVGRAAAASVDPWLRNLDGRPDLIRQALAAVLEDERAVLTRRLPDGRVLPATIPPADGHIPFDPTPHLLAERYAVRELLKAPGQWLPEQLTATARERDANVPVADLVGFGWATPWERERTRRLVGLDPGRRAGVGLAGLVRGRPGALFLLRVPHPDDLARQDGLLRAARRGAAVKLAVRLYQAEHGGAPPPTLAALVPDYLPEVPADPFGDGPFRYRVIRPGEVPDRARRSGAFAEGQPVAWSVGLNGTDEGGWAEPSALADQPRKEDLVFPVPPPPKQG